MSSVIRGAREPTITTVTYCAQERDREDLNRGMWLQAIQALTPSLCFSPFISPHSRLSISYTQLQAVDTFPHPHCFIPLSPLTVSRLYHTHSHRLLTSRPTSPICFSTPPPSPPPSSYLHFWSALNIIHTATGLWHLNQHPTLFHPLSPLTVGVYIIHTATGSSAALACSCECNLLAEMFTFLDLYSSILFLKVTHHVLAETC